VLAWSTDMVDECSLDARSVEDDNLVAEVGETGGDGRADVAAVDDAQFVEEAAREEI